MANPTDNLPSEMILTIPRAYRDYLRYRRTVRYSILLALYLSILSVYYNLWRHGRLDIGLLPHFINLAMSALVLLITARLYKGWQYTVDGTSMELVFWQWRDTLWEWHGLQWRRDVILNVEPDEWHGLPALRIQAKLKGCKTPQDLWMVYAHEDQDTVQNIVLPLIEKYRKQYRHPLWADLLRQEKQTL